MKALTKKILAGTVAVVLASSAASVFARGGKDGQQRDPAERLNYIFTQLEISETQQADVLDVMETLRESQKEQMKAQKEAMRDADTKPTDEERQAMREEHKATQMQALTDQLNTVLSPEKTEAFVDYLEAHMPKHKKGMRGHGQKGGNGQKGQGNR